MDVLSVALKIVVIVIMTLTSVGTVLGQTATPPPTPTPSVVTVDSGTFVVEPVITFGEAGVIVSLVLVSGLLLLRIALEVVSWFRQ